MGIWSCYSRHWDIAQEVAGEEKEERAVPSISCLQEKYQDF